MATQIGPLTESVYYILLSLTEQRHGYGIMQDVKALTNERVDLGAGTLYGALTSLIEKKWIIQIPSPEDSRRKDYLITAIGRAVLEGELERLRELVQNGEKILAGGKNI